MNIQARKTTMNLERELKKKDVETHEGNAHLYCY